MARPPSARPVPSPSRHLSEDEIEAFAMGKPMGPATKRVRAHLLACDRCCLRMVHEVEFIAALRRVLRSFKA